MTLFGFIGNLTLYAWKFEDLYQDCLRFDYFMETAHTLLSICICVCVVSEPTLKWKLKKLISTRPNPLQRKISAPPSVKHRTETLGTIIYIYTYRFHDLMFLFDLLL